MRMNRILGALGALALSISSPVARAQDDSGSEDDELRDIMGGYDEETAAEETAALRSGETGDNVGARNEEEILLLEEEGKEKLVIKTIQRKNFLKLGRLEFSPHAAFVANDPFLNRYIVGAGVSTCAPLIIQ